MRIYLDHNATTTVRPEAIAAMTNAMATCGNPSSVHAEGQAARAAVERARMAIGKALCARPQDIVFTSGGTEATNLALHSAICAGGCKRVIFSAIEHEAVAMAVRASGVAHDVMPVTPDGVADLAWLEQRLAGWDVEADGRPFLALMLANNEIGAIQPVAEAARLMRDAGGLVLVDAIQAVGKIPVDFAGLGADYMAISGHKTGGPQGVGALLAACDAPISRHHHGGGQEQGRRSGTENVPGIAAFGKAVEIAVSELDTFAGLADARDRIIAGIKAAAPDAIILGEGAPRLPNTVCVATPGWSSAMQVMGLDLAGIAISGGSACSSGTTKTGKIPAALGLPAEASDCAVRISLGWSSQPGDADRFIEAWTKAYARVRAAASAKEKLTA